jgi:hypothetical protein
MSSCNGLLRWRCTVMDKSSSVAIFSSSVASVTLNIGACWPRKGLDSGALKNKHSTHPHTHIVTPGRPGRRAPYVYRDEVACDEVQPVQKSMTHFLVGAIPRFKRFLHRSLLLL